jgi:hypothetical protein
MRDMRYAPAMGVPVSLADIEAALGSVQRTLDRLTAAGEDKAAFELARAQFAASIRSSWPGNLGTLAAHLEKLCSDAAVKLDEAARADLRHAIAVFREIKHP